jgi:hypothetical protein
MRFWNWWFIKRHNERLVIYFCILNYLVFLMKKCSKFDRKSWEWRERSNRLDFAQFCFWNLSNISGLSQICKIRNVWKLPSPFSRNTLIPSSKKTSWSLKTSFWFEKWSNKVNNGHEKFLRGFRTSRQDVPKLWKPLRLKNFHDHFWICWKIFLPNDVFKLQKDFSDLKIRVFLEEGLGNFQIFLILKIWDRYHRS